MVENNKTKIAIIIVNWNNWEDTCECLSSIFNSTCKSFQVLLIDNGSEDNSIQKIQEWTQGKIPVVVGPSHENVVLKNIRLRVLTVEQSKLSSDNIEEDIVLIQSNENLGFAKACNIGIRFALNNNFTYSFLLNNDTTIHKDCLSIFIEHSDDLKKEMILTPIIYYYDDPQTIWYYGGSLTFTGRRNIILQNKQDPGNLVKRKVSFVSGCGLFTNNYIFKNYGLLTEDFFFGEEDYEFSYRMHENGVSIFVLPQAKVYHKVGRSNKKIFTDDRLPYIFIGYLNRFIDKKVHAKSKVLWELWRMINLLYILPKLFLINKISILNIYKMFYYLIDYSSNLDCVNREMFFKSKKLF